jgi:hypothetical protein
MSPSELTHKTGEAGVRRAQAWLLSTARVQAHSTVYDKPLKNDLQMARPDGSSGFFDISGYFASGPFRGHPFVAEVKYYSSQGNQSALYREFLADCYIAALTNHSNHHFMWITWHPFGPLAHWATLSAEKTILDTMIAYDSANLTKFADAIRCANLAERLWIIVLSDRQARYLVPPSHVVETIFGRDARTLVARARKWQ